MDKLEKRVGHHQYIVQGLTELYKEKDQRYGDSFTKTLDEFGTVAVVLRLSDKLNRLKTLWQDPELDPGDESVIDTLRDLANYSIMTIMYSEEREQQLAQEVGGPEIIAGDSITGKLVVPELTPGNWKVASKEEFVEILKSQGILS